MTDDPIVKEVYQVRAKLLDDHGGGLDSYVESLQQRATDKAREEPIRSIDELHRKTIRLAS